LSLYKSVRLTASAIALAAVLSAGTAGAKPMKWSSQGDINSADPYMRNQTLSLSAMSHVYEGLIRRDPSTLAIQPALAERWEVVEPTRWRYHLRRGVKFHDGSPFTADDVVFSADRARSKGSEIKGRLPGVTQVVKVDDYTVDFVTEKPNPILHVEWATWGIFSKVWSVKNNSAEVVDPSKGDQPNFATTKANGTGPFRLKSRVADVKTEFTRNHRFVGLEPASEFERDRGDLHANQVGADPGCRPVVGRDRHDGAGAGSGHRPHQQQQRHESDGRA